MGKHRPSIIWLMRKVGTYPNAYVETVDKDRVAIAFLNREPIPSWAVELTRRDARLLAKRINQCLDETRG